MRGCPSTSSSTAIIATGTGCADRRDRGRHAISEPALEPLADAHEAHVRADAARVEEDVRRSPRPTSTPRHALSRASSRASAGSVLAAEIAREVVERTARKDRQLRRRFEERGGGRRDRPVAAAHEHAPRARADDVADRRGDRLRLDGVNLECVVRLDLLAGFLGDPTSR